MNLIEFTKIISDPSGISKGQTRGLDQILQEYPYFQAAHFLRLYALKKQRSFRYNDTLKKTAAYTTDRELLFNYITSFDFDLHAAPVDFENLQTEAAPIEQTEVAADEKPEVKDAEAPLEKEAAPSDDKSAEGDDKSTDGLEFGRPLDFKKNESYSFGEWLQISQLKPIDRSSDAGKPSLKPKLRTSMDLINDFITKSPRIKPSQSETYEDMALESSMENEQLMTETLAHVYLEQKKYEKAIAAFTVLSLKYPEKSSFFADRIEAVRKLQNN
jgi:hypothetical protein